MLRAICHKCNESFFADMVRECAIATTDERGKTKLVRVMACGVCALDLIRACHGAPRYEFQPGTLAHELYTRCSQVKAMRRTNGETT